MIDVYQRPSRVGISGLGPRIAALVLSVAMGSGLWHVLVREWLFVASARWSVGNGARLRLIVRGIHQLHSQSFPLPAPSDPMSWLGTTYAQAEPYFLIRIPRERAPAATNQSPISEFALFDDDLRLRGTVCVGADALCGHSADHDADGEFEMDIGVSVSSAYAMESALVVARIRIGANAVVGAVATGRPPTASGPSVVRRMALWQDADGDGRDELLVRDYNFAFPGGLSITALRTWAVFEWDPAGGCLRPRQNDDPVNIKFWVPPDGVPLAVSSESPIEVAVVTPLRELLESMQRTTTQRAASSSAGKPDDSASP